MALAVCTTPAEICKSGPEAVALRGGLEVLDHIADEWRELCEEASAEPFYRPEWIRAYVSSFAPKTRPLIVTMRFDNRLCLVLPLLEEAGTYSKIPIRRLRSPVNQYAGRFDAVRVSGPDGQAAVACAWECLNKLGGWDLIQFQDAPEGGIVSQIAAAARAEGLRTIYRPDKPSPYVPIPTDPALLGQMPLNSRLRRELRHVRRELTNPGSMNFYRVDTADPLELERFYQIEASGWKGRDGTSILHLGTRSFFDQIAQSAARFGYFSLYMLELKGELAAAHFGFTYRDCYYSVIVAYNENLKEFSPGHLMVSEIVRDCVKRRIRCYDITGKDQEWKMKWTNQVRPVSHYHIFRGPRGSLAYTVAAKIKPAVRQLLLRKQDIG